MLRLVLRTQPRSIRDQPSPLNFHSTCFAPPIRVKRMSGFQKPLNGWLVFYSIIWITASAWFTFTFATKGNIVGAGIMLLMGIGGIGLWFRSRMAAWVMIAFAVFGIINALLNFSTTPGLRIATRLMIAVGTIFLMAEYLQQLREDSEE